VEASTKLTRRKRGEAVPFFDDKGGVRRVITGEMLATSINLFRCLLSAEKDVFLPTTHTLLSKEMQV